MPDKNPEEVSPEKSQQLDRYKPEIIEYPLEFSKIPNGSPEDDRNNLDEKNEPSEEVLREFFTPEAIERLIYCPKINIDETDDWGMFGYEPGYIFVNGRRYEGHRTLNDELLLIGRTLNTMETASGQEIWMIPHKDFLPRDKFIFQTITPGRTPRTFMFLRKLLENVKEEDLSSYPTEDLYEIHKKTVSTLSSEDWFRERAEYLKKLAENDPNEAAIFAKQEEERYKKWRDEIPQNTYEYLKLVDVFQRREGINNPWLLKFLKTFEQQQSAIHRAIDQANQNGNTELASKIAQLAEETTQYRQEQIFSPRKDKKLLE